MIQQYARVSSEIAEALKLSKPPVAICFSETLPAGLSAPASQVPAGCRFWQDATSNSFATTAADHSLCAIGMYTHNLEKSPVQQTDLMDAMKVFGDLGYVRPEDLPLIPVLQSQPRYVIYSPLASTPLAPDVVFLFADAAQALILSEATQQVEGDNAPAMGRPACAVVPQVVNSGRAAMSLGCCGARAYLNVLDNSTARCSHFQVPASMLMRSESWRSLRRMRCFRDFIAFGGRKFALEDGPPFKNRYRAWLRREAGVGAQSLTGWNWLQRLIDQAVTASWSREGL